MCLKRLTGCFGLAWKAFKDEDGRCFKMRCLSRITMMVFSLKQVRPGLAMECGEAGDFF